MIPNGVDVDKFKPNLDMSELKAEKQIDGKVILSVGAIHKQKGYHLLLQILPEILREEDVNLILVGEGPYLGDLQKMARKLGVHDKVFFAGKISRDILPKYYNLADVVVFPTLMTEGLPLVVFRSYGLRESCYCFKSWRDSNSYRKQ